jgi:hypothetical protein
MPSSLQLEQQYKVSDSNGADLILPPIMNHGSHSQQNYATQSFLNGNIGAGGGGHHHQMQSRDFTPQPFNSQVDPYQTPGPNGGGGSGMRMLGEFEFEI